MHPWYSGHTEDDTDFGAGPYDALLNRRYILISHIVLSTAVTDIEPEHVPYKY